MAKKRIIRNYRKVKYVLYRETLINAKEHFWAFLGSFVGLGIIAYLQYGKLVESDFVFLIGSFGASCVLVYGVIESPLAQPRNLIGGHFISAIIGVTIQKLIPDILWLSAPLAVALSIILMQITKTLHPPGGATALIAVTGSTQIKTLGYLYVIFPVLLGTLILFFTALIFNNMTANRQYPSHKKLTYFKKTIFNRQKNK